MNKLPLEIENEIWNIYYMDKYKTILHEYISISNLKNEIQSNVNEIKKYFRKYRFSSSRIDTLDNSDKIQLKILLIESNKIIKNITLYPKCILKYLMNINVEKLNSLATIYKRLPSDCYYISLYLIYTFHLNKKYINILYDILYDCNMYILWKEYSVNDIFNIPLKL